MKGDKMKTYTARIDGGEGGETTFCAKTAKEALVAAISWAEDGDWPDGGCECEVSVEANGDPDDCDEATVTIASQEAKRDQELIEDGEEIAKNEHEYSTEKIVVMEGQAFYMHENGGARGAHDRQCGDGVWRERPCEPTREISKGEARCLMLDWGYSPKEVAAATKHLD